LALYGNGFLLYTCTYFVEIWGIINRHEKVSTRAISSSTNVFDLEFILAFHRLLLFNATKVHTTFFEKDDRTLKRENIHLLVHKAELVGKMDNMFCWLWWWYYFKCFYIFQSRWESSQIITSFTIQLLGIISKIKVSLRVWCMCVRVYIYVCVCVYETKKERI
jgi:hypothetical protein